MAATPSRIALASVLTDDFLPGFLTMVESFRDSNPWFSGDIIAIHQELSGDTVELLKAYDPQLLLRPVSQRLATQMDAVSRQAGWRSNKKFQFASIETTAIESYDRVIFCDSDVLFIGDIEKLHRIDAALIACPDGANLRGNQRQLSDYKEVSDGGEATIGDTFNSGMMIFKSADVTAADYNALIGAMDPARWANDMTGHTDQWLFNERFAGRHTLVSTKYNFMLSHHALIEAATGESLEQAKVVHFTGPNKPWLPLDRLNSAGLSPESLSAYRHWRLAFDALCERHQLLFKG